MAASSKLMITEAERRFPCRIKLAVPAQGLAHAAIDTWLDKNCGADGWAMTPAGLRGVVNDTVAIYFLDATWASAFVARWCAGSKAEISAGAFRVRDDQPAARVGAAQHRTPLAKASDRSVVVSETKLTVPSWHARAARLTLCEPPRRLRRHRRAPQSRHSSVAVCTPARDAATKMHHLVLVTVGLAAFLGLLSTLSLAKGARDVPPSWVSWGGQSEWEIAFCGMTQRWLIAGFVGLAATLVMSVVSLFVGYYAL